MRVAPHRLAIPALSLALVAVGVALAVRGPVAPGPACPECNVVLVTFDALRADHLGAYGYGKPTSPEIDRFAARSTVFLRNMSQAGSTISSVPSLHTSKYPHVDRLLEEGVLRESEETLAEILSRAGYTTIAVIANSFAGCRWGACQGMQVVDEDIVQPERAETTLRRALAMLDAHAKQQPFFLWVHFRVPHTPYDPGREAFELFYEGADDAPRFYDGGLPSFPSRVRQLVRLYQKRGEPLVPYRALGTRMHLPPSVLEQLRALYDGNIREGDRAFGALLADLGKRGLARRTVVVVAADHGESLGEHHIVGHNALYDGILHTPLIIHVPGRTADVVDRPSMNVDILPTVLPALGLEVPERIRGVDILGETPPENRVRFAEYAQGQTIVASGWKLLTWRRSPPKLYHLTRDPMETASVASERPERVQELLLGLQRIQATSLASEPSGRDTDVLEKLRALGYIDEPDIPPPAE